MGRTSVNYIPVNETVEMELGDDVEVLVKPLHITEFTPASSGPSITGSAHQGGVWDDS